MKKRLTIIVAVFFLAQGFWLSKCFPSQPCALNPSSRILELSFQQISSVVCTAVTIYKDDVFGPLFRNELADKYKAQDSLAVRFDVESAFGSGPERYYPVSIGGESFIIRIFTTAKPVDDLGVNILFEMKLENPAVTCQVLPNISAILSDCKIKPRVHYSNTETLKSS